MYFAEGVPIIRAMISWLTNTPEALVAAQRLTILNESWKERCLYSNDDYHSHNDNINNHQATMEAKCQHIDMEKIFTYIYIVTFYICIFVHLFLCDIFDRMFWGLKKKHTTWNLVITNLLLPSRINLHERWCQVGMFRRWRLRGGGENSVGWVLGRGRCFSAGKSGFSPNFSADLLGKLWYGCYGDKQVKYHVYSSSNAFLLLDVMDQRYI